jgi:hypothetical protein
MKKYIENKEDEIDLITLLRKIKIFWIYRKQIFITTTLFIIAGVFVSINLNKKYTSTTIFINSNDVGNKNEGLAAFAGLAGINIGNSPTSINNPLLYNDIIQSTPFLIELSNIKFKFKGVYISFKEYYFLQKKEINILSLIQDYTIGLPKIIISSFKNKNISNNVDTTIKGLSMFSEEDVALYNNLKNIISITVDKKSGLINLVAECNDPFIAAIIANIAQNNLQNRLIDYKQKSTQKLLLYTQELYDQKRKNLFEVQDRINNFKDKNIFSNETIQNTQLIRLQSEYSIANSVFISVSNQLEQAKVKLNDDLPLFTIIEPAKVPNKSSSSSKLTIIMLFGFVGFMFSCFHIIIKIFLLEIIPKFKIK